MHNQLTFGSVCSGIESASLAWESLGWSAAWLSEIAPFPSAVLAHRYPGVKNLGDMSKISTQVLAGEIAAPDVLVGGTPCQSFSLAGNEGSLDDPRGQLTLTFVELANAIDTKRRGSDPSIIIWENVPGVLRKADNAFGCFLSALVGETDALEPGSRPEHGKSNERWAWKKKTGQHIACWPQSGCVYGPQRRVAWRTINAEHFGVAQRRRRVFVIASARQDIDPSEILFEFARSERDSTAGRGPEEKFSSNHAPSAEHDSVGGELHCFGGGNCSGALKVAATLTAHGYRLDYDVETFVVHQLQEDEGAPFSGLRRLMPVEYERLQGFPEDWTRIPYNGKSSEQCEDAQRYKAVGNSIAVPVMRRLGEWIQREVQNARSAGNAVPDAATAHVSGDSVNNSEDPGIVPAAGLIEEKRRPFLKWAGGKFSVLDELAKYLPPGDRLVEPFVGAGSVFLNFRYPAYLSADINADLVNLYRQLAGNPDSVIRIAQQLVSGCVTNDKFLAIRNEFNDRQAHAVRHAALFLALNRTCFNGLTRYNADGVFNTGWNKKDLDNYFPEQELHSYVSRRVNHEFLCASFEETISRAGTGDVIYCDPPYEPLPGKSGFVKYDKGGFHFDRQVELADHLVQAHQRGAQVVITNSGAPKIIELYTSRGFSVHELKAKRNISCKGDTREIAKDVIATLKH
ncbi:Dam family site-specific DNA-(adenine-N6)-methyltransferase [Leclercia adecarboxylata]|uniref:Dam family site-specific DNA-(adenine-N6)-methyltransferase n=1 Tax=Leclercia adecarboxylata TaxID=83655 RepID=UPI0013CB333E|nr:Dam family site-specific DNA-(adenine-N6)-methyltransferase [Leclercia adecarboxylata]NEG94136.1 Dam family site-specific DNA-(adenine-N6)-methyltransferase [Leclercia adecarboxylata]